MQLKDYFDRIERLESEISDLREDLNEVYKEAKGAGFDTKAMKLVLRLKKMTPSDRQEQEYLVETYRTMLGL